MKKNLFTILMGVASLQCFAQQNVVLKINHKLIEESFMFDQASTNNLNNNFIVQRLEYYLSNIIINHDGGQSTPATDVYALVNAEATTYVELGNFDVTNIEGITFGVGVNPEVNNDDPTLWPSDHPLAPQNPSMHWGWSAGYRFVAMEGEGGEGLLANYEIHALGNSNYFSTTVEGQGTLVDGNLEISIDADYSEALKNIDVSQNLISHGSTGESITLLENFRDHVFSSSIASGINDVVNNASLQLWPNPSTGEVNVSIKNNYSFNKIIITDLVGRIVFEKNTPSIVSDFKFDLNNKGVYFLQLFSNQNLVASKKLIVEN